MSASLQPLPTERPADHPGEARPLDIIFIEGFVGHTVIGIYSSEQHQTQPLLIDLQAGVPRVRACDTDRIADTIDYAEVRERLLRLMAEHRFKLLEAFAEAIADILIDEFGAHWVRVKVAKPRKVEDVAAMGVLIERERRPVAAGMQAGGAQVLQLIGAGMVPGRR